MVRKQKNTCCLGYVRASTSEQCTDGVSLSVQRTKIEAYCSLNDLALIDIVEDAGISGKSLDRQGIQSVLERLRDGEANAIAVLKLDRLSRSTRDVLHLVELVEKNGWQLHSIGEKLDSSTASGRFTITILSALAQMEREQIGERTSQALQHKKMNGDVLGTTPFGFKTEWDEDGKRILVPTEEEQVILNMIGKMRDSGMSFASIAEVLNKDGVQAKRGGRWHPSTIQNLIQKVIPRAFSVQENTASIIRSFDV